MIVTLGRLLVIISWFTKLDVKITFTDDVENSTEEIQKLLNDKTPPTITASEVKKNRSSQ